MTDQYNSGPRFNAYLTCGDAFTRYGKSAGGSWMDGDLSNVETIQTLLLRADSGFGIPDGLLEKWIVALGRPEMNAHAAVRGRTGVEAWKRWHTPAILRSAQQDQAHYILDVVCFVP